MLITIISYILSKIYSHPINITIIVNIFSASVLGATLPKPTEVSDVNVKYRAVTYLACELQI